MQTAAYASGVGGGGLDWGALCSQARKQKADKAALLSFLQQIKSEVAHQSEAHHDLVQAGVLPLLVDVLMDRGEDKAVLGAALDALAALAIQFFKAPGPAEKGNRFERAGAPVAVCSLMSFVCTDLSTTVKCLRTLEALVAQDSNLALAFERNGAHEHIVVAVDYLLAHPEFHVPCLASIVALARGNLRPGGAIANSELLQAYVTILNAGDVCKGVRLFGCRGITAMCTDKASSQLLGAPFCTLALDSLVRVEHARQDDDELWCERVAALEAMLALSRYSSKNRVWLVANSAVAKVAKASRCSDKPTTSKISSLMATSACVGMELLLLLLAPGGVVETPPQALERAGVFESLITTLRLDPPSVKAVCAAVKVVQLLAGAGEEYRNLLYRHEADAALEQLHTVLPDTKDKGLHAQIKAALLAMDPPNSTPETKVDAATTVATTSQGQLPERTMRTIRPTQSSALTLTQTSSTLPSLKRPTSMFDLSIPIPTHSPSEEDPSAPSPSALAQSVTGTTGTIPKSVSMPSLTAPLRGPPCPPLRTNATPRNSLTKPGLDESRERPALTKTSSCVAEMDFRALSGPCLTSPRGRQMSPRTPRQPIKHSGTLNLSMASPRRPPDKPLPTDLPSLLKVLEREADERQSARGPSGAGAAAVWSPRSPRLAYSPHSPRPDYPIGEEPCIPETDLAALDWDVAEL